MKHLLDWTSTDRELYERNLERLLAAFNQAGGDPATQRAFLLEELRKVEAERPKK